MLQTIFLKAAKTRYETAGWKYNDTCTVAHARFSRNSANISVQLDSEWSSIGNGWEVKPSNNLVVRKLINNSLIIAFVIIVLHRLAEEMYYAVMEFIVRLICTTK